MVLATVTPPEPSEVAVIAVPPMMFNTLCTGFVEPLVLSVMLVPPLLFVQPQGNTEHTRITVLVMLKYVCPREPFTASASV